MDDTKAPEEEPKDPEGTETTPSEDPEGTETTGRERVPPGKPVKKPSREDVLASLHLLRNAEAQIKRVVDIGAVKVAGNLLGTVASARRRAEEANPLQRGGNLG